MLLATEAVVLHAFPYLESSRILRLATRDAGVVSALARGARRPKNRFGALDLFTGGTAQLSVRRPATVPLGWNGELGPTPEDLARRIAALDAAFQRRRSPTTEERQEYERRRGGLKAQLADALARGDD